MKKKEILVSKFFDKKLTESLKLASKNTEILVDFDETLLLRNSTAEYLNSLKPRLLGALLLKIIYLIKPWQWIKKIKLRKPSEDWFLVFFTTILMPWNIFLWSAKAQKMAKQYSNYELIETLNKNKSTEIIVVSVGFNFIIEPILKLMPIKYKQLICCRFWQGLKDRQKGKLAMIREAIGMKKVSSSIAITDSLDDLPLLMKVASPFLIVWEQAKYQAPMTDIYFPLLYLHKVKRVGENYIVKSILLDDFPILILAFTWLSQSPILQAIAMLCFVFSFWCIYEFGYYENDLVAEKYEKKPVLSDTYYDRLVMIQWWQPWIWSLAIAIVCVVLISAGENNGFDFLHSDRKFLLVSLKNFYSWFSFLLLSRLGFFIYNYLNKPTRIWLYPLLQFFRYCGFLVLFETNIIGVSLILGHVLARSTSYLVYRYAGANIEQWGKIKDWFLRWLLFITFVAMMSIAQSDLSLLFNWQTTAVSCWWLLRCRKQVIDIFNNIKPIWHLANQEQQINHRETTLENIVLADTETQLSGDSTI